MATATKTSPKKRAGTGIGNRTKTGTGTSSRVGLRYQITMSVGDNVRWSAPTQKALAPETLTHWRKILATLRAGQIAEFRIQAFPQAKTA